MITIVTIQPIVFGSSGGEILQMVDTYDYPKHALSLYCFSSAHVQLMQNRPGL